MISVAAMAAYLFLLSSSLRTLADDYNLMFWLEWIAVWAFAAAWLTKGRAILADIAIDLMSLPGQVLGKKNA